MKLLLIVWLLQVAVSPSMQVCSNFPGELDGVWTSTKLGTITISSSAMTLSTTITFHSSFTSSNFECVLNSGTQYVFKMNETVPILGGTLDIYPYGCFDFRPASNYSYYFYLNSAEEITLGDLRFRAVLSGSTGTISTVGDICDSSTVDVAEFYTMIKSGSESQAISDVQCPDEILGYFKYTYTDQTGTFCDSVNTSTVLACSNQNRAELLIDNTGCTERGPFYSAGGQVGCIANVFVTGGSVNYTYTSYYNRDATVAAAQSTYQFTCVAMTLESNGTVFLSLMPTDCVPGQTATARPTKDGVEGATMVLEPVYTCVPTEPEVLVYSDTTSWIWLIILLVCLAVLIIFIIVIICLHRYCKQVEKKRAREKKILITEEHPLGEMSIALDAPASMERVPEGYIDVNNELFVSPKTFKKKDMMNPMNETSMNLSFKEKSWVGLTPRKSIVGMQPPMTDPFSEMDSGIVLPISSLGSKTARSMRSPTKQKSFLKDGSRTARSVMNGDVRHPLAITDGRTPYPVARTDDEFDAKSIKREKSFSESVTRSKTIYAPSVRAPSVGAPSVKALSVKAPSIAAKSTKSTKSTKSVNSNKALSIQTNRSRKPPIPKFVRSTSKTRLGSVTKRSPQSSPRKKMNRSKTMVVPLETHDSNEGGMAEFMNAEMSNWGSAASQTARSRRSSRTTKASLARSKTSVEGSPRKSILKKKSRYMSSEEFLTEEEKYNRFIAEASEPPSNSASVKGSAGRSLQEEYNDMVRRNDPLSSFRRTAASRKPWH